MNNIRVTNGLDPDQVLRSVGPDLGPNSLQRLSARQKLPLAKKELMLQCRNVLLIDSILQLPCM